MKKIKMLVKIIRIKKGAMNSLRIVLAGYFKEESHIEKEISELSKSLEFNNALYESMIAMRSPDIKRLERLFTLRSLIENQIGISEKRLKELSEKINNVRNQITEVRKEIKLYKSLKEKRLQQIKDDIAKAEQKESDDIAGIRFLNRMQNGL